MLINKLKPLRDALFFADDIVRESSQLCPQWVIDAWRQCAVELAAHVGTKVAISHIAGKNEHHIRLASGSSSCHTNASHQNKQCHEQLRNSAIQRHFTSPHCTDRRP